MGEASAGGSDAWQDRSPTAEREELARFRKEVRILREEREILKNEPRALTQSDLWVGNSVAYAHTPEAVAVRFLVTS